MNIGHRLFCQKHDLDVYFRLCHSTLLRFLRLGFQGIDQRLPAIIEPFDGRARYLARAKVVARAMAAMFMPMELSPGKAITPANRRNSMEEAMLARALSILTTAASWLPGDMPAIRPLSPAPEDPAE
jgi:hypothetical protein